LAASAPLTIIQTGRLAQNWRIREHMDAANALHTCVIINPFRVTKFRVACSKMESLIRFLQEGQMNVGYGMKVCWFVPMGAGERRRTPEVGQKQKQLYMPPRYSTKSFHSKWFHDRVPFR
jgi:hypothetical protein